MSVTIEAQSNGYIAEWMETKGVAQQREWRTKLTKSIEAVCLQHERINDSQHWIEARRMKYLVLLRERASPILFLACCCALPQNFYTRPKMNNKQMISEITDIVAAHSPDSHIPITDVVLAHLRSIISVQETPIFKDILHSLKSSNHLLRTEAITRRVDTTSSTPGSRGTPAWSEYDLSPGNLLSQASSKKEIDEQLELHNINGVDLLEDIDTEAWEVFCTCPAVFDAADCWEGGKAPPHGSVLTALGLNIGKPRARQTYHLNGTEVLAGVAMSELLMPSKADFYVINIPTPNFPKLQFPESHCDAARQNVVLEVLERTSNLGAYASKFAFHIDGGQDALVACLKPTVKVVFMAPPSPKNIETLLTSTELKPDNYEECVMAVITADQVLHIPAGCIHGTITMRRGVITGINFVDRDSLPGAIPAFLYSVRRDDHTHLEGDLETIYVAFKEALESGEPYKSKALAYWDSWSEQIEAALDEQSEASRLKTLEDGDPWTKLSDLIQSHRRGRSTTSQRTTEKLKRKQVTTTSAASSKRQRHR